jgi:threonine/homoserine/homoserine lactone efflux protein
MASYLILGITFAFAAAIQPGPLQSYFISESLSKGWRRTLPAAFAPIISDGPIIALVVILLSQAPSWLINVLQIAGGILLLFLAVKGLKSWKNYDSQKIIDEQPIHRTVIQATFVNFLNPAPYLGWSLVMGPLLIKGWRESPINGIALLVGFYTTLIISSMVIIIVFASTRKFGIRATKTLIGLSAIALGCFGIYQLWAGISYFIQWA